ncbi:MAG TPA: flavodoxin domain-containing protein [Streptosporangiaceae bacterium]
MQAVVVYESMFGNTRAVAEAIGAGLTDYFDVVVVPVAQADPAQISDADLVVVGGPTHAHGMSRASTRLGAANQAEQGGGGVTLEPHASGDGVREWLGSLGTSRGHGVAAAFDTRMRGPAALTGRASKGISNALRRQGYELISEPESFFVTKRNTLVEGERDRAREWGVALASRLALVG